MFSVKLSKIRRLFIACPIFIYFWWNLHRKETVSPPSFFWGSLDFPYTSNIIEQYFFCAIILNTLLNPNVQLYLTNKIVKTFVLIYLWEQHVWRRNFDCSCAYCKNNKEGNGYGLNIDWKEDQSILTKGFKRIQS